MTPKSYGPPLLLRKQRAEETVKAGGQNGSDYVSFSDDHKSTPEHPQLQAIPECEAEALAWGYGPPPADHVSACRAIWWRQVALGHRLPAELGLIVLEGGTR